MAIKPFLIVGCPRSGTTILSSEIQKKFNVGIVDELNLELLRPVAEKREISPREARKTIKRILLYKRLEMFLVMGLSANIPSLRHSEAYSPTLFAKSTMMPKNEFVKKVLKLFSGKKSKLNGLKLVGYKPTSAELIEKIFGTDFRIIIIERNPAHVVRSWIREKWGPKTIAEGILLWRFHQRWSEKIQRKYQRNCIKVDYAAFTKNPDKTLKKIQKFLGVTLKNKPTRKKISIMPWYKNVHLPVFSNQPELADEFKNRVFQALAKTKTLTLKQLQSALEVIRPLNNETVKKYLVMLTRLAVPV